MAARQAEDLGLSGDQVNGQPNLTDPTGPVGHLDHDHYHGHHHHHHHHHVQHHQHAHAPYPAGYPDDLDYSSDEDDEPIAYDAHHAISNGATHLEDDALPASKSKRKKKKKQAAAQPHAEYIDQSLSRMPLGNHAGHQAFNPGMRQPARQGKQDRIWNTSTQEERERIKEFWLSLSEADRKSLLKIEKTAVLNKMKEQQKHSCSCTVCGRKRTAIEEELEVLYDAYYEELAQYANQPNQDPTDLVEQTRLNLAYNRHDLPPPSSRALQPPQPPHHRTSRVHEIIDEDQSDEEEDNYSDEEDEIYSDEDDYDESDIAAGMGAGFFDFGNNLTVKGGLTDPDALIRLSGQLKTLPDGILTVADDLLKNDGKKFIEMMEQLAERRMQREQEVEYASQQPSHTHNHGESPLDEDEDYDEEDDYESPDDYDEDEDEEDDMVSDESTHLAADVDCSKGGMTEEQRMEEGRRMFQIFAARMFEQRVLTAYREKVALERQSKLLEELEEEDKAKSQKDAKRARDAEKKKNKKAAQKQAKAEEKAKKEAEKAAEEAAAKAAEERKLEEQRRKREEQKKKKEAEKKAQEEEKNRKEAERNKRLQEERDRQAEADRKVREQKASEKRLRDEQRKKEREDKEAREKEIREQKAHDEKQRRDLEASQKANKQPIAAPQIIKRPSQPGAVAVPPALPAQRSPSGLPSPHVPVATPALPKPATPGARNRQASDHESHPSAKLAEQLGMQSTTRSPPFVDHQASMAPKTILQNPNKQQQQQHAPLQQQQSIPQRAPASLPQPQSHQGYPPGAHGQFPAGFGNNMSFPSYPGPQAPMVQRQGGPPFSSQPAPHSRPFAVTAPGQPLVANKFGGMPTEPFHAVDVPSGFQQQVPGLGQHPAPGSFAGSRAPASGHSRQNSSNELDSSPIGAGQPISRPAPIQRPSSVRPSADGTIPDVDNLSKHLGSSALLGDAEPVGLPSELRRTSNPPLSGRAAAPGFSSPLFGGGSGFGPSSTWSAPFGGPSNPLTPSTTSWNTGLSTNNWSHDVSRPGGTTSAPRLRKVRVAVCTALRHLSSSSRNPAEYHDVSELRRYIQQMNLMGDHKSPSLPEVEDILDIEGDATNGGGTLDWARMGKPDFAVRLDEDTATQGAGNVGEIGSPVLGGGMPAFPPSSGASSSRGGPPGFMASLGGLSGQGF